MTQEPEIPALGRAYAHARKAYTAVSAVLIAWELIGIELENHPIEHFKITIKSPQAVPYVLIVLVFYFSFRTTIEWAQTDARRRGLFPAKLDFIVAHTIAATALG